jgi:hypothetical protein
MILDPTRIAVLLSSIAAVLAAIALLKSGRSDPAEMGALGTRLALVLTDNLQRDEARARGFREEIGGQINDGFTRFDNASCGLRGTTLGRTIAGSVEQLGQAARLACRGSKEMGRGRQ